MDLHNFLAIIAMFAVLLAHPVLVLSFTFTSLGRLFAVCLPDFHMSSECQIRQAHFPRYASGNFQLSLSKFK